MYDIRKMQKLELGTGNQGYKTKCTRIYEIIVEVLNFEFIFRN